MTKNEQIKQILTDATNEVNKILDSCSKMNAKYFAWVQCISDNLLFDFETTNHFCKNMFLSEIAIFDTIKFRKITSLSELNKEQWIIFLNNVQTYFLDNYDLNLE
jgi:hypothetical protein